MTGFVGRKSELGVIDEAFREASERGRGTSILVRGEPGMGKTALAAKAAEHAAALGCATAWGACWEGPGAPPLWPWIQVLRGLDLAALSHELLTGDPGGYDEAARFALFDRAAGALAAKGHEAPVLVVLDDLHWADTATLQLARFLTLGLRSTRIVLLATTRPVPGPSRQGHVADLGRCSSPIDLTALTREELAELLARDPEDSLVERIHSRSGGNPLFARELGRAAELGGETSDLPPALREVLDMRFSRLDADVLEMLAAAAVLGASANVPIVAAVIRTDTAKVEERVAAAEAEGILRHRAGELRFTHVLLREALVERLPARQLRELHRDAARVLDETDAEPAEVLSHWTGAGDEPETARWALAAARTASARFAHEEAAAHYRLALESGLDTLDIRLAHGEALLRAGHLTEAREEFFAIVPDASAAGDGLSLARAVLGYGSGATSFEVAPMDVTHVELLDEALGALGEPAGHPERATTRARLLARRSVATTYMESAADRTTVAEEAVSIARSAGDPVCLAYCISALCDAIAGPAHVDERPALAEEMIELGRSRGDLEVELLGRRFRVVALLEYGRISAIPAEIEAFAAAVERLRAPALAWYPTLWKGMLALLDGRHDHALAAADEVGLTSEATGSINAQVLAETLRVNTLWDMGHDDEALAVFESLRARYPGDYVDIALAYALARAGDLRAADRILDRMMPRAVEDLAEDSEFLEYMWTIAGTARLTGARRHLEAVRVALEPYADLWAVDGIGAATWGVVAMALGEIALELGDPEVARSHLERALDIHERAGARRPAERCRELLANLGRDIAPEEAHRVSQRAGIFRCAGEVWELVWEGKAVAVKDAKGLHDIATLLASPGREFHVLDLVSPEAPREAGTGPLLDRRAREDYRKRIRELGDEIDDAEVAHDTGRAERARIEMDLVLAELTAGTGLGGRQREAGKSAERARKAVSTRIANVLSRIEKVHPPLARHLRISLRTGTFCAYEPERPTLWTTRD